MSHVAPQRDMPPGEPAGILPGASVDPGVAAALAQLLDGAVVTRVGVIRDHVADLFAEELPQIHRAVPKRRWEYSTARFLAREAMHELGLSPGPIVNHAVHRYPFWPPGVVGSISHSGGYCAVAIGAAERYLSIGLDIEASSFPFEIRKAVCTEAELTWIAKWSQPRQLELFRLVFSAKECFYKCCSPLLRPYRVLDFQCVDVDIDLASHTFVVRASRAFARAATFDGRFVELPSFTATAMWLDRGACAAN
jgi:4'-phosphopantetheinyl transferase EntD